jgi:hypothetical protein
MSNQTPDRSHASGTFVPVVAAPFTTSIVNSKAIKSFLRNGPGNYTVGLSNGLAFAEGNAEAALPANFLGIAGATIAPDGESVLVSVFDLSGVPVDPPAFGLEVRSIEEGEGKGPQPPLPAPPAPPVVAPTYLLGWSDHIANGNASQQSVPALVDGVDNSSAGEYEILMLDAAPDVDTVVVCLRELTAGQITQQRTAANIVQVRTFDAAGVLANHAFTVAYYQVPN